MISTGLIIFGLIIIGGGVIHNFLKPDSDTETVGLVIVGCLIVISGGLLS